MMPTAGHLAGPREDAHCTGYIRRQRRSSNKIFISNSGSKGSVSPSSALSTCISMRNSDACLRCAKPRLLTFHFPYRQCSGEGESYTAGFNVLHSWKQDCQEDRSHDYGESAGGRHEANKTVADSKGGKGAHGVVRKSVEVPAEAANDTVGSDAAQGFHGL